MKIAEKLAELNIKLTPAEDISPAIGAYAKTGSLIFTSGMVPPATNGVRPKGKVGREFTTVEAQKYVRETAIELLGVLDTAAGSLDNIKQIVSLQCFVNSVPEYTEQSILFNTASDLFYEIFGEKGKHSRYALSMGSLPMGVPVEIAVIAEVEE